MSHIRAGDFVEALPIGECTIGHPKWHAAFAYREMDRRIYLAVRSRISAFPSVRL